jgi:hypothetical protein
MQGLKKLIFWMIVIAVGYYGLDYVKVHTSRDVIAYKRFAKAILEGDAYGARQASSKELAAKALSRQEEREELFDGTRVLFTYFEVVRHRPARDGKSSSLVVDQVSRVTSSGKTGIWGDGEIRIRHTVQLEQKNQHWTVSEFIDPVMR